MALSITWLGHATFILGVGARTRLLFDPWLSGPACPAQFSRPESLGRLHAVLLTHGHHDHSADVLPVTRASGAPLVCIVELADFYSRKGVQHVRKMNIGGTIAIDDVRITMTPAPHSTSLPDRGEAAAAGLATSFVLRAPDTPTIFFAGDTALFRDLKTIGELYAPEIAFLPIGDLYTMGPDSAAIAARWLGVRQVVPMHWGTFPELTGTPALLREQLAGSNVDVLDIAPGQTAE